MTTKAIKTYNTIIINTLNNELPGKSNKII